MGEDEKITELRPVEHGTWLYIHADGGLRYWVCSNCRQAYHRKNPHDRKYCYHCGAEMKMEA